APYVLRWFQSRVNSAPASNRDTNHDAAQNQSNAVFLEKVRDARESDGDMPTATAVDFDPRHKGARHKNMRPKPAASIILIKPAVSGPRFLMGKRAETLTFLPGYFVFPGGRLERQDRANRALPPAGEEKLGTLGARLVACARRELTEETGLAAPENMPLNYIARAITPPGHIRRYDTRFFAAIVDEDFGPKHMIFPQDNELDPIDWFARNDIPPEKLHRITTLVLDAVETFLSARPDRDAKDHPIPCFRFRHGKAVVEYD
ncbi:MAG: NUDIX hydrolase, partial [Pseudomonadota bacterium]